MGKHVIESFYPAPGVQAPRLQVCHWGGLKFGSQALKEEVADYFNVNPDDIKHTELEWGDNGHCAEFFILDGRILGAVGVFADLVDEAEWQAILARPVVPLSM